jgi:hypothetical protein
MKPSWANLLLILVFLMWGLSFLGPHVVGETSESKRLTLDERSMREAGMSHVTRGILSWVSVAMVVATVYLFSNSAANTSVFPQKLTLRLS